MLRLLQRESSCTPPALTKAEDAKTRNENPDLQAAFVHGTRRCATTRIALVETLLNLHLMKYTSSMISLDEHTCSYAPHVFADS